MQASDENVYRHLALDLSKNFDFDIPEAFLTVDNFLEHFRERLVFQILDLLQNDYNRLLAILYRIDVDEKVVENVLQGQDMRGIADQLAGAVIERLLQKIRYRMGTKREM